MVNSRRFQINFQKFKFDGYNKTISFVNAVAWIAESEDHHPDLTVKYGSCTVLLYDPCNRGLSENDFICAKKIDNIWLKLLHKIHGNDLAIGKE